MPAKKGKKGRKTGRQSRRASFQRYWSPQKGYANRAELHAARRQHRHELMVEESRKRKKRRKAA